MKNTARYSAREIILRVNGTPGVHIIVDSQAADVTLTYSVQERMIVTCLNECLTLQASGERLDILGRREESVTVYDNVSRMRFNDGEVGPTASATPQIVRTWVYSNGMREIRTITPEGNLVEATLAQNLQEKFKLTLTVPSNIPIKLIGRRGVTRFLTAS